MSISKVRRALRGDINPGTAALEVLRRARVQLGRRSERAQLANLNRQPARLTKDFAKLPAADLLAHFRNRKSPRFFAGFTDMESTKAMQRQLFSAETDRLIGEANAIVERHCWPLLGFGAKCFGAPDVEWNRDPLSKVIWPLDYHAELNLLGRDGSDVRVVWELNRLSHLITMGRAYALTNDEKFSAEFCRQISTWRAQNPVARGVNWNCPMEVALRAMNLLGAFELFLPAPEMTEEMLLQLLMMFDQHGQHIRRNLEFSYLATSNHYLCDVAGLLWLGIMLPELDGAIEWREFGLREILREMDKQILPDGVDYEASTGYHRLKLELFLYSFVLCRLNQTEIAEKYWEKLRAMIDDSRAFLRPDGQAPLIGDSDSGQVFPILKRGAHDHSYVLAIAAAVFQESRYRDAGTESAGLQHSGGMRTVPEEVLWILGAPGLRDYEALPASPPAHSKAFADAGIYILRENDLYLLFNAGGVGVNGRGSHGHNDALSIEVSACGTPFIVDPGTYLYTSDLHERHLFRSTAYHSTVEVDGMEQNTIDEQLPFVIANEGWPNVIRWEAGTDADVIVAEHYGYRRLKQPITHRRTIRFDKRRRFWLVGDELTGEGTYNFAFRFHLSPGRHPKMRPDGIVEVCDNMNGARLWIAAQGLSAKAELQNSFSSNDYGAKAPSVSVCWKLTSLAPLAVRFKLVPIRAGDDEDDRYQIVTTL